MAQIPQDGYKSDPDKFGYMLINARFLKSRRRAWAHDVWRSVTPKGAHNWDLSRSWKWLEQRGPLYEAPVYNANLLVRAVLTERVL